MSLNDEIVIHIKIFVTVMTLSDVERFCISGCCRVITFNAIITALHWACLANNGPVMDYLIRKGADVNAVNDKGQKPFDLLKSEELKKIFASNLPSKGWFIQLLNDREVHTDLADLFLCIDY